MPNTNKKNGNRFETEICDYLSSKGWWAHNFAQNESGQPCDIIACKDGKAYLIDAKICKGNSFSATRIEQNQILSMTKFQKCGNEEGYFAIRIGGNIYMARLSYLIHQQANGAASINVKALVDDCLTLEQWEAMYANHR